MSQIWASTRVTDLTTVHGDALEFVRGGSETVLVEEMMAGLREEVHREREREGRV